MVKGVLRSYKQVSMGTSNYLKIVIRNNFMVSEEHAK